MKFSLSLILIVTLLALYSCSDSISKPSYKFKKSVGDGVAAKVGDISISEQEMVSGIENDLYEAEKKIFDIKFDKVRMLVIEKLMEQDPKKKGLSNDEYMDKYIVSKIKVSKDEIENFIKEKNIPDQHINDGIKERIRQFLMNEKKVVALDEWVAEKTKGKQIEVFFQEPKRPTFDVKVGSAPVYGSDNAKVTIVEFSDFQCPFCSKGADLVNELKKKYGNKIRVAFKNYPLPFHHDAKGAAVAGLCAHEQGKDAFWKMHDEMFANQNALKPADLKKTAAKLKLDEKKFAECLDSNKYLAQVNKDMEEGQKLGVKSTPTFFVNGALVQGAQPIEVFSEIIDSELAQ